MIRGLGIDIVEIDRIQQAIHEFGGRMKFKVFTELERAYCDARHSPALHYAARWAAKEAFSKAMRSGISGGLSWQDVSVESLHSGEPRLVLSPNAIDLMKRIGASRAHVSLSHAVHAAVAVVVIE